MAEDKPTTRRTSPTPFRSTAPETSEQQEKDAQMIFNQVTSGHFGNYERAEFAVTLTYVGDPTVSRSGISRALELLKRHYSQPRSEA